MSKPVLAIKPNHLADPLAWGAASALACIAGAGLVVELALGPGEDQFIPEFPLGDPPLIIVMNNNGGIRAASRRPIVTLDVPAPDAIARAALWQAHARFPERAVTELANQFRLTSGNLVRCAEAISVGDGLDLESGFDTGKLQAAARNLHDSRLEAVAKRVEPIGADDFISLDEATAEELAALSTRCRHREVLAADTAKSGGQVGVRALFAGPSGTGKTLAARWLARELKKDLYRLDLAASISKYIGDTEKVLDRAFSAAEDLDCILLIDEGDALMTRRTDVTSANDRYANLETNFLLQRIECFDGILVVTTNAAERIDKAFGRRMDVVAQFRLPDEVRRYEILDHHLGDHCVPDSLLQEVACRCPLSGGQLRNVALHARLLALDADRSIGDHQLRAALMREYRKLDAHCPLKPQLAAAV